MTSSGLHSCAVEEAEAPELGFPTPSLPRALLIAAKGDTQPNTHQLSTNMYLGEGNFRELVRPRRGTLFPKSLEEIYG